MAPGELYVLAGGQSQVRLLFRIVDLSRSKEQFSRVSTAKNLGSGQNIKHFLPILGFLWVCIVECQTVCSASSDMSIL